jgi:hypothetical protein
LAAAAPRWRSSALERRDSVCQGRGLTRQPSRRADKELAEPRTPNMPKPAGEGGP